MTKVVYTEMDKIINDAYIAFDYAWEHYIELRDRKVAHVLYGPNAHATGAAWPGFGIKDKERQLLKKTRRKEYMLYELDGNYQILCNKTIKDGKIQCSYYHFELNGVQYARSFLEDRKAVYTDNVYCVKYLKDEPAYCASVSKNYLYLEMFEYLPEERCIATRYSYYPASKITQHGYPMSFDAPYGAVNSPVTVRCYETKVQSIDFSRWFVQR